MVVGVCFLFLRGRKRLLFHLTFHLLLDLEGIELFERSLRTMIRRRNGRQSLLSRGVLALAVSWFEGLERRKGSNLEKRDWQRRGGREMC